MERLSFQALGSTRPRAGKFFFEPAPSDVYKHILFVLSAAIVHSHHLRLRSESSSRHLEPFMLSMQSVSMVSPLHAALMIEQPGLHPSDEIELRDSSCFPAFSLGYTKMLK